MAGQPPKLVPVITEEPSQQVTPLLEDRGEPPSVASAETPQPTFTEYPSRWLAWLDVARVLGFWLISIVLLGVVPIVTALPYLFYRIAMVGAKAIRPEVIASDKMLIFYSVLGILPAHLLTLYLAWLIVTEGGLRPFWKALHFEWPEGARPAVSTLLSVMAAIVLFGVALGVTTLYGGQKTELDLLIESSLYTRIATAFVAFATAPLVEEVIYRGVIYSALEKAGGVALAVTVVSLLFAGVHVFQYRNNISVIIVITLLSITLSLTRAVTGKLLPCFIIHLVFNGVQSILIVLGGFIDKDLLK